MTTRNHDLDETCARNIPQRTPFHLSGTDTCVAVPGDAELDQTVAKAIDSDQLAAADRSDDTSVIDASSQPTGVPEDSDLPDRIGDYKVVSELGRGGMGAVYKAIHQETGQCVAIKVMNRIAANDETAQQRFHKEARLLAEVNNPWVTNLLDSGDHNGVPFIAIEFVDGTDLRAEMRNHAPFSEHQALMIVADVARALEPAHERGIVHRDIKPGNILLSLESNVNPESVAPVLALVTSYRVRLADFGLARHIDQSESLQLTQTGAFLGTPVYMSPEQCKGTGDITSESDVYALGVTLFEMLTGQPPFAGEDAMQLAAKHCFEAPPSVTRLNANVSDATQRIVEKALAKHPLSRYADASQLLQAIEAVLHGEPETAAQHPALPLDSQDNVHHAEFEWRLNASPEQLWPFVSDTERINEALGLPAVEFTDQRGKTTLQRFGKFKLAGLSIEWEEHPFEWVEGRRFGVLRDFSKGPFDWFTSTVTLDPQADGSTLLKHSIRILPKGLIGRMVATMEINVKARRSLDKVYSRIDRVVSSHQNDKTDPFRDEVSLSQARRGRLDERLENLLNEPVSGDVVSQLADLLAKAPSQQVARIKTKEFARRLKLDPLETLQTFLYAAKHNLLEIQWDILCPTCRIPSDSSSTMKSIDDHGHCEACDANFELDLASSIELVFRAHPEIRDVETKTYCIGGPGHSPHVVAQITLNTQERFELETQLEPGEYILRGPALPYTIPISVSANGGVVRSEIPLRNGEQRLQIPVLNHSRQTFTIANETKRSVQIRLERTIPRRDVVTASEATSLAVFRELFPLEAPRRGQLMNVTNLSLLLMRYDGLEAVTQNIGDTEAYAVWCNTEQSIRRCVMAAGGVVVNSDSPNVMATFDSLDKAVHCAGSLHADAAIEDRFRLSTAIHRGPMIVTNKEDRISYFGQTLQDCRMLLQEANARELLLSADGPGQDAVVTNLIQRTNQQSGAQDESSDASCYTIRLIDQTTRK